MKVAEEFSNSTSMSNLSASKLIALFDIPADERQRFIEQPQEVNGQQKTVDEMTTRELQAAIKVKKEAEGDPKPNNGDKDNNVLPTLKHDRLITPFAREIVQGIEEIDIDKLCPFPDFNNYLDDVEGDEWISFVKSIKKYGVLVPIVITQNCIIVSGHQRVRACKELGIKKIPCVMKIYTNTESLSKDENILLDFLTMVRFSGMTQFSQKGIQEIVKLGLDV